MTTRKGRCCLTIFVQALAVWGCIIASVDGMDEARLLARLDRIDALDRTRAAPGELLAELRGLLCEAEARARSATPGDGEEVVERSAQRPLGT